MYSGKSGCIHVKVVLLGQKLLYSGKVVVYGTKVVFGQKWLYLSKVSLSEKVVVFGQSGCF